MTHLAVLFSHDPTDWVSNIIAVLTFGKISHCALLNEETGMVMESTGSNAPRGVREVTYESFMEKHPNATIRYIPHSKPRGVYLAAQMYLGCGYDWFWFLGYLFKTPRLEDHDKFGCAELIAQACIDTGEPLLAGDHTWHVTPYQLWQISKETKD